MVKIPCFHCRGRGFDSWLEKFHMPRSVAKNKYLKEKVVWCHEGWVEERNCRGGRRDPTGGCCSGSSRRGWAEAEVIWGQRHRTFGQFGRGGPRDRQVEPPPTVPPQQTQDTLRVRWSGFKPWVCSCLAGEHHQQHPHPLMPQLRNGQRRIRLRGNRQHWAENQGHMVSEEPRGVKGVGSH